MRHLVKQFSIAIALIVTLLGVQSPVVAAGLTEPVHIRIATTGIGSSWYIYGATFASAIRKGLPGGSTIDVLPIAGSTGNPLLVERGEAEFGLTTTVTGYWAIQGMEPYKAPLKNVTAVAGGFDEIWMAFIVTKKSGLMSIDEIKEKKYPLRLLTAQRGGGGELVTRMILSAYGMSYDSLEAMGGSAKAVPRPAVAGLIREGKADAYSHSITLGHPTVVELSTNVDVRFLPLKSDVIEKLAATGLTRLTLPVGTFRGVDEPVATVGSPTVLIARADLPEELVYHVTKALAESKEALARGHAGLKPFDPETAWQPEKIQFPLHPGAVRYYQERGWMK
jgi:TRAP transporter TAXI family solute receptor